MICPQCGNDNMQDGYTSYYRKFNDVYFIMENVPCKRCPQCGEEYFSTSVLDKINNNIKEKYSKKEKVNLLDYSKTA